jgi:hypothetical protein
VDAAGENEAGLFTVDKPLSIQIMIRQDDYWRLSILYFNRCLGEIGGEAGHSNGVFPKISGKRRERQIGATGHAFPP